MANDDLSEPPEHADSKNPIFILCRFLGLGHLRGPGVSLGWSLGVPSIEPFLAGGGVRLEGSLEPPPPPLPPPRPPAAAWAPVSPRVAAGAQTAGDGRAHGCGWDGEEWGGWWVGVSVPATPPFFPPVLSRFRGPVRPLFPSVQCHHRVLGSVDQGPARLPPPPPPLQAQDSAAGARAGANIGVCGKGTSSDHGAVGLVRAHAFRPGHPVQSLACASLHVH